MLLEQGAIHASGTASVRQALPTANRGTDQVTEEVVSARAVVMKLWALSRLFVWRYRCGYWDIDAFKAAWNTRTGEAQ